MNRIRGICLTVLVAAALLPPAGRIVRGQEQPVPVTTPAAAQSLDLTKPAPNVPATEAVPVQQVPSPAAPTHAPDQIMWALIASYALQYLKTARWFPMLTEESTARIKSQFGFLSALLTAAGVHFAITGSILDGGGASITVTGLSLDAIKDVAFQWASQQAWFDLVVHRRRPDAVVAS